MSWDPGVSRRLMEFLAAASAATLAAFDADGTLWSVDVGEAFLRWAGEEGKLKRWARGGAVWEEYQRRLDAGKVGQAFELCVTAFAGLRLDEVQAWARFYVDPRWKDYLFPPMRQLVQQLHRREAEVWVVSASPSWVVEPAAALLEIPASRVIAAEPRVEDGVIGEALAAPLPADASKVTALVPAPAGLPTSPAGTASTTTTFWNRPVQWRSSSIRRPERVGSAA